MKKVIKILSGFLIVIAILSAVSWHSINDDRLKIYFFDVGQGDAILIRTPSQQNIIIDGGPDNSFITKLGEALPFYDRQIDLMVLTHPHDDHLFGLVEVLKRYKVDRVLYSGVANSTEAYLEWLSLIQKQGIPLTVASSGQTFIFDGLQLKVIYPFKSFLNQQVDNLNNSSVVMQLIYKDVKALFMGDLELEVEENILMKNFNLESQILKIGHHGSDTSSSENFLQAVSPEIAIIQVGEDNKFGHPSRRINKRLERLGTQILRTDLLGDIILYSNGHWVDF